MDVSCCHPSYLFSIPLSHGEENQWQRETGAILSSLPSYPILYWYFLLQELEYILYQIPP